MKLCSKKLIAFFLIFILAFSCLYTAGPVKAAEAGEENQFSVFYDGFGGIFSPFFAQQANDMDVVQMTQIPLLASDRDGAMIEHGTAGETVSYSGKDYTYYSASDVAITSEGAEYTYTFTLRDDLKFSDGKPLTADDVIFTMYVLCDPTYNGQSTFGSLPIKGLAEYKAGVTSLLDRYVSAGRDNTDFSSWTAAEQEAFWEKYDNAVSALAEAIYRYCVDKKYAAQGSYIEAAEAWGISISENTAKAFADALLTSLNNNYGGDIGQFLSNQTPGPSASELFPKLDYYAGTTTISSESAPFIEGIKKIDSHTVAVTLTKTDVTALYQMGIYIAPLHYYGDPALFDYDSNKFGFEKASLFGVRAKNDAPMGAGPYRFVCYKDSTVTFEANELYFKGAPKTKAIKFITSADSDIISAVADGKVAIANPAFAPDTASLIKSKNSNGALSGDKIYTRLKDNLGYGYFGISAKTVKVGNDPGSEASKNLRKALATALAFYREEGRAQFYGDAAAVINYPISNSSWAAPRPGEDGYETAFAKDIEGNTFGASEDDMLTCVLGYLEAAGYTVEDGRITAAPEGAKLEYELMIPGGGVKNHPSFLPGEKASEALARIGLNLKISDLSNSADLWTALDRGTAELWTGAWSSTADPDMYQIYYSDTANAAAGPDSHVAGPDPGPSNYMYRIADASLDELVLEARSIFDKEARKTLYKQCLNIIMDWAVEVPYYQRQNATLFSPACFTPETIPEDLTPYYGWINEVEKAEGTMEYVPVVPEPKSIKDAVISGIKTKTYTGSKLTQTLTVTYDGVKLVKGTDYTVSYTNNTAAGTAKVKITGIGNYTDSVTKPFTIKKAVNPLKVTGKAVTLKASAVKKKAQTITRKNAITVSGAKGTVTYAKSSGNKNITIAKNSGKLTVKKGLKKGTYKVKIKVTAAGTSNYSKLAKTCTVTIKIK